MLHNCLESTSVPSLGSVQRPGVGGTTHFGKQCFTRTPEIAHLESYFQVCIISSCLGLLSFGIHLAYGLAFMIHLLLIHLFLGSSHVPWEEPNASWWVFLISLLALG